MKTLPTFKIDHEPFGVNDSERAIEIPWALSCLREGEIVLEVGYANAEPRYLEPLSALNLQELWGVDYDYKDIYPKMKKVKADIRDLSALPRNYFDSILCVSTIEHVGFDNAIYFKEDGYKKHLDDDLVAATEMLKRLKQDGKLILTVPFGKGVDYEWFFQYDGARLDRLFRHCNCKVAAEEYFIFRDNSWHISTRGELKNIEYMPSQYHAAGLCCVLLVKRKPSLFSRLFKSESR